MKSKLHKQLDSKSESFKTNVLQQKSEKTNFLDNRKHVANNKTIQSKISSNVKQLKGDRHYWVKPAGGTWQYVKSFKDHSTANDWWAANKATYPGGEFSQGNTKTKFK